MDDELRKDIEDHIQLRVAAAFSSIDEIVEGIPDNFFEDEEEYTEEIADECLMIARRAVESLMKEQESWRTPTDNTRLEQAFADLEQQGIVARENWTCCQTCGHAEIGAEIEDASVNRPMIGYTFYHQQDTDTAVEGGGIMLAYGATSESNQLQVPKMIANTLSRHGFKVEWDGSTAQRICIPNFTWRRRWQEED